MMDVQVTNQIEFDAALQAGNRAICVSGTFRLITDANLMFPKIIVEAGVQFFIVARESSQPHVVARESSQPHVVARESSQPHVEAWESSQPHVEAWESSQPHVVAWESSQPHVVARGSSQPHVVAWGSSQPHVVARGYAQLSIFGAVIATLTAKCSAVIRGIGATVTGGHQVRVVIATPQDWCDYYGVPVEDGIAVLFKALNDDYTASRNRFLYAPGSVPVAPDYDGGTEECGGGLHFSPSPAMALEFHTTATRFMACPVKLADIAIHPEGDFPHKVKARGCCAPIWEVDRRGAAVPVKTATTES